MLKTGRIWRWSHERRDRVVREVCEALERTYGQPRLGNPDDPVDDLIYIIISNRTTSEVAKATYDRVEGQFATWQDLLSAPRARLYSLLESAGLATVKSRQIREALSKIREDFGQCSLDSLREKCTSEIHEYLVALPGVSDKVAKCVMLFTMGEKVLPVDGHVHRIASRLGWTSRKRADQCHEELEALVSAERRYAFHVDCIVHGRSRCRPRRPDCGECVVREHCSDFEKRGK